MVDPSNKETHPFRVVREMVTNLPPAKGGDKARGNKR